LSKIFPNQLIFKNLEQTPLDESENMLANLMNEIIENSELRDKYSNGQKRAEEFSYKRIIKDWEKLL